MKTLKRLCLCLTLICAFGLTTFAGDMPTGPCSPSDNPGDMPTGPCSPNYVPDNTGVLGDMQTPTATTPTFGDLTLTWLESTLLF